jgi:hypothetical protein
VLEEVHGGSLAGTAPTAIMLSWGCSR